MADIKSNIAAFELSHAELEEKFMGQWVLFHDDALIAVYSSFDDAANDAVTRFGRGPYLIRQVGTSSLTLPASVMFQPIYG